MRQVYVAKNPAEAHLLKEILESGSIQAVVRGEFLWGARGELPIAPETCPSVWVIDDADYERAMEVIKDFRSEQTNSDLESKEWKCKQCGESNEGQFTECWQCGASRSLS